MPNVSHNETFESICHGVLRELLEVDRRLASLKDHPVYDGEQKFSGQHAGMRSYTMLAIRDVADARMHIERVIEYLQTEEVGR